MHCPEAHRGSGNALRPFQAFWNRLDTVLVLEGGSALIMITWKFLGQRRGLCLRGGRFPPESPSRFSAHFMHTGRGKKLRNSQSEGKGSLMPDQHSGERNARENDYKLKHLPLK